MCKNKEKNETMTAAGFLQRVENNLSNVIISEMSHSDHCLFVAIENLREACLVMAADIAGLKRKGS